MAHVADACMYIVLVNYAPHGLGEIMALETIRTVRGGRNSLVEVRTDIRQLERELKRFGRTGVPKAQTRAMNSAIRRGKTAAKRSIARQRFLSAKQAEAGLSTRFATETNMVTAITGRGRMLPLTKLKTGVSNPRQQALGVKANTRTGKRTLIGGAFIARMPSGHIGVFVRSATGGGPRRVPRLPIQELRLPSIAHTLTNEETVDAITEVYGEVYEKQLFNQLNAAIRRANARLARGR